MWPPTMSCQTILVAKRWVVLKKLEKSQLFFTGKQLIDDKIEQVLRLLHIDVDVHCIWKVILDSVEQKIRSKLIPG